MSLEQKINDEIKKAMLAKNQERLSALRAIKSEILLQKTSKGSGEISPEIEISILQKLVKQRKDSAQLYLEQKREDLYNDEVFQANVIEEFLPEQLSEEKVKEIISDIVEKLGATSMKDMGKVMGASTKELAGRADNKLIARIVKEILNK
ncbi:MAG: GatB/YqeY domain-containing protein [Bacteroidales bacterium]|jgi:uncharacterized protein YqeY